LFSLITTVSFCFYDMVKYVFFSFLFFFNGFSGICLAAPLICFNVLKFSTFDCKNIMGSMRKLSSCMVFDIDFTFGTMY